MFKLPHNFTHLTHSKVTLKILQARFQQSVNHELPDVQAGFRKGRETRDQIANICWITEKAREFQKNIYFCFIDYAKALSKVIQVGHSLISSTHQTRCHDLSFRMLSLKPTFSLSSFTFIKRLLSSLLSAIRVVSSAYLRLLIFLPTIQISARASSSPAFLMMYSAYKLNKQGDNIQP